MPKPIRLTIGRKIPTMSRAAPTMPRILLFIKGAPFDLKCFQDESGSAKATRFQVGRQTTVLLSQLGRQVKSNFANWEFCRRKAGRVLGQKARPRAARGGPAEQMIPRFTAAGFCARNQSGGREIAAPARPGR